MHLKRFGAGVSFVIVASAVSLTAQNPAPGPQAASAPARVLIVGGGPDKAHNQVAIESNVRYVSRVLPDPNASLVFFADGDLQSEIVQYQAENRVLAYRKPDVPRLDGSAEPSFVDSALTAMAQSVKNGHIPDALLYFTGHGSPDVRSGYTNNWFDLWKGNRFTVKHLAEAIKDFPKDAPIALLMVQCYSGAFGNVIFKDGDPDGDAIPQHLAGFFAAQPNRLAAGCTPALNEAEYRDFTGYFVAALTGEDRMGRPVSGADYDHDSHVGMNEALAWSLIHDDSIDTPMATSDTFVRRFGPVTDTDISSMSFETLESWATPAQRAALEGLSEALALTGDDRLRGAFARFATVKPTSQQMGDVRLIRFVNLARTVADTHAVFTTGDKSTKERLTRLLLDEARNPIR